MKERDVADHARESARRPAPHRPRSTRPRRCRWRRGWRSTRPPSRGAANHSTSRTGIDDATTSAASSGSARPPLARDGRLGRGRRRRVARERSHRAAASSAAAQRSSQSAGRGWSSSSGASSRAAIEGSASTTNKARRAGSSHQPSASITISTPSSARDHAASSFDAGGMPEPEDDVRRIDDARPHRPRRTGPPRHDRVRDNRSGDRRAPASRACARATGRVRDGGSPYRRRSLRCVLDRLPRGAARRSCAIRRGATRRRCQGSRPTRPSGRAPGRPTSGSRNARLRCTGPAGGPLASHDRPRRERTRATPATSRPGTGNVGEPPHCVAEEPDLVDGLRRADVRAARGAGPRCTTAAARDRGLPRPRQDATRPRPCRSSSTPRTGVLSPWPVRAR